MAKVLLVEDEEALARGLEFNLKREGFDVVRARRGDTALDLLTRTRPDLVTLDVMLPGPFDGFEVCREIRRLGLDVPIIMLTARAEEVDRILGLEIGADDYLVKPFSVRELVARIRARLRRDRKTGVAPFARFRFGPYEVDFEHFAVTREGRALDLTAKEFAILRLLVEARGEVVHRNRILDEVWNGEDALDARRIDTHIVNLRRKLKDDPAAPRLIQAVYGEGYRFTG
jgi:two-component system, OmpR family, alkaline phosphatase synthesis response regulator PhoP